MKVSISNQIKLGGVLATVVMSTSFFIAMMTGILNAGDGFLLRFLVFLVVIATCVNYVREKRKMRVK